MSKKNTKEKLFFPLMSITVILVFFFSFMLGRYQIDPITLIKVLLSRIFPIERTWNVQVETVIFQIRFPRIIAALFVGASLSLSGLTYQGLFQNPMVSPDVLGTTSGAAFGAALGIFMNLNYIGIAITSFVFGLVAVLLVMLISSRIPSKPILALVLSGIMISSLFSSLVSFIKLVADTNNVLPSITYYLMGSLSSIRKSDVWFVIIIFVIASVPLIGLRWKLNVMTQGDEEATTLGVNTKRVRAISIISSTLMTAATVAVAGMIGWVGLVIPHFVRMCIGCDYRKTIPASMLMGSAFLLFVDTIARNVSTMEIPLGILTSFIGAPFFIYLIIREGKKI